MKKETKEKIIIMSLTILFLIFYVYEYKKTHKPIRPNNETIEINWPNAKNI